MPIFSTTKNRTQFKQPENKVEPVLNVISEELAFANALQPILGHIYFSCHSRSLASSLEFSQLLCAQSAKRCTLVAAGARAGERVTPLIQPPQPA